MADKPAKPTAKAKREQPSVLGTLPSTRPERIGRPRESAPKTKRETPRRPPTTDAVTPARPATRRRNGSGATPAPTTQPGPTAVRRGAPSLEPHRATDAPPPRPVGAPTGTELVTTTIRAAGELAQIGLTVGGQVLKRAVDRFPRP